ncbi:MAG: response regulator transcription factor [Arcobacteraceae bacterium]|nr:response regulator transcription factor [Arcobacteraceae bacterium]
MNNTNELSKLLKEITILYVEDEYGTRDTVSQTLSKFSDNIKVASNGAEALDIYSNHNIQLIITDIEMPVMDGIAFISEVRKNDITTPVIMLTAYSSNNYLLSCVNLNIQAYILKPINYAKLKEALFKVVEYLNLTSNIHIHISKDLSYDKINGVLIIHETQEISLNKKEKAFMNLLVEHKNNLVTYSEIEHSVWYDFNEVMTESALRTVVKNLRKKSTVPFIDNISGIGYKLHITI